MFCSQCGKKVMDTMLFCPFCGAAIVIPEQEEELPASETAERTLKPEILQEKIFEEQAAEEADAEEKFEPLNVHFSEEAEKTEEKDIADTVSELLSSQLRQEPVRLHGLKPDLTAARQFGAPQIASARNTSDTFVPQRDFDPDDMFMDADDEEYDDYDYEDEEYEEQDEGSFWLSHIRGLVAVALFAIVAAVLVGWSFSNSGQQALARADLAWRATPYAEIAYGAYQRGAYSQAGSYYAKAVERDADNYDYAYSAGVAYYMAQDMMNAEAMARHAIQISPEKIGAYELILRVYPDASLRPLEIQSLLNSGYEKTGDSRLNPAQ